MKKTAAVVVLLAGLFPIASPAQQETPHLQIIASPAQPSPQGLASQHGAVLEALIQEALEKNPAIQTAERRVAALRARVPQAKSLPDPTVSFGWMGNLTPFDVQEGDPSSFRFVSANQKVPFPGKLKLRGQIAGQEAEAAWWEYEQVRRRVIAEVKAAYYDYFYYHKAIEITRKNRDLLAKLASIAEVRYKVGQGIQQDALKAQVELSRILQRLTVLEQQERTAQVRLNTLLNREPEAPLPEPAPFSQAELTYSLESLYQLARENDTQLHREDQIIERNEYALNLARKEYYPDFGVGYMYQNRPLMPEMHGVTFSLSIPVFYKSKQREGVNEATHGLLSARKARENRLTEVYFEVKEQYLAAKASRDLARLFSEAIVPQSTLALESSLSAYEVGKVDFLSVLDNFITVLNYQINYYRELTSYQIALARLEPLVGLELTK